MNGHILVDPVVSIGRPVAIYLLVDPRDDRVRYVGKAQDPVRRLRNHLETAALDRYKTQKNSWLKSLRSEGLKPELYVIEWVDGNDAANERECFWIAYYRAVGARLTNGTIGGDGVIGKSPEARARISAVHLGSKRTAQTRAKMSESAKRRAADPTERERLRSISNRRPPIRRGETNKRAKLSDQQIRELRERAAVGEVLVDLAAVYGITRASVTQIVTGQTRVAAGGPTRVPKAVTKLSEDDVTAIRLLASRSKTQPELARQFGISQGHVSDLISQRRRPIRPGTGGF